MKVGNLGWLLLASLLLLLPSVASQAKSLNIVFIPKSSDQVFWDLMRSGVDDAVREFGDISLTWRGPSYNDDTAAQIRILQVYTRPEVDAILIAPTDQTRLVAPISKAAALGIKMIVLDSAVDGDDYQYFITTNNYYGGRLAAKRLAESLNGQGRVVLFRTVAGSASTDNRAQGFIDYLREEAPGLHIVADIYGGGSRGKALHKATQFLAGTGPIDGIFTVNESATDGMLRALRNAGLAGKIKLVGFDVSDFLLAGLDKKEIDALFVQDPRQMGYEGIKAAVAAIRHRERDNKIIFTGISMMTGENRHSPEMTRLIQID